MMGFKGLGLGLGLALLRDSVWTFLGLFSDGSDPEGIALLFGRACGVSLRQVREPREDEVRG